MNLLSIVVVILLHMCQFVPLRSAGRLKKEYIVTDSALPAISRVWVLSRNRRSVRLEMVLKKLEELAIPFQRFPAIDLGNGNAGMLKLAKLKLHASTKLNVDLAGQEVKEREGRFDWNGASKWQSHLQIYFHITNGTLGNIPGPFLILEDDVNITSRLLGACNWEYLFKYLPYDWEMVFLNHKLLKCHEDEKMFLTPRDPSLTYCRMKYNLETNAYVIRDKKTIKRLVEVMNTESLQLMDSALNKLMETKQLKAYAILDKPVGDLRSVGTTHVGIGGHHSHHNSHNSPKSRVRPQKLQEMPNRNE
jgi:hypothetical protein